MEKVMSEVNDVENVGETSADVLSELLKTPESRQQVEHSINLLVRQKTEIVKRQDVYKDTLKATAEALNLSTSYITVVVDAIVKDNVAKKVKETSLKCDLLSMFLKEDAEGTDEDEE